MGFLVFAFFKISILVFVPNKFGYFGLSVHCSLQIFLFLGIWFSTFIKNGKRVSDLVSHVVFAFFYLGSTSSSIWAAIECLH